MDTLVQPESNDIMDRFPHFDVLPVEIRLFFGKEVEVIFARSVVVFPCTSYIRNAQLIFNLQLGILAKNGFIPPKYELQLLGG